MFKRQLLLIWLVVATTVAVTAEQQEAIEAAESSALISPLLDERAGVLVIDTNRESQPVFNVMDIIVSYNGIAIKDKAHLKELLKQQATDKTYTLGVVRNRKLHNLEVNTGPWHVDLHDMTQEAYATLITDQNTQSLSKLERQKQLGMLQQYLKGRPYRTPNNQGTERDEKSERRSDGAKK